MTVAKIIIFLLTIFFLLFSKKRKTDTYFFRNLLTGLFMLVVFLLACMIFYTPFSIGNMLLIIGSVIVICNLGEKENILRYGISFFMVSVLAYIVVLFL